MFVWTVYLCLATSKYANILQTLGCNCQENDGCFFCHISADLEFFSNEHLRKHKSLILAHYTMYQLYFPLRNVPEKPFS